MSLEASIEKLTAAIEAATGVLVALQSSGAVVKAGTPAPDATAPRKPGRPPKAPAPAAADTGLGDDGEEGDGGLGDDGDEPGVTPEQAKGAVLAYRDKAVALKGKEAGLQATRTLMKKFVANIEEISDDNAAEIHKTFTAEVTKLKK